MTHMSIQLRIIINKSLTQYHVLLKNIIQFKVKSTPQSAENKWLRLRMRLKAPSKYHHVINS